MDDVIAAVDAKQPGDEVELTLLRDGDGAHRDVTLGERPANATADPSSAAEAIGRPGHPTRHSALRLAGPLPSSWRRMQVKICGITRLEDAEQAVRLGAWAIGLNHYREQPAALRRRRRRPRSAPRCSAQLEVVGVFVNPTPRRGRRRGRGRAALDAPAPRRRGAGVLRARSRGAPGCKVIKAVRVRSAADVQAAEAYRTDFHLLDAHRPGTPGGTGESFDWELLPRAPLARSR